MSQELTTTEKVIVMKGGLAIFLSAERAKVAEDILASGTGHRFLQIDDRTINSAEIEGIYGAEQYAELQRVKNGEYKCRYGKWHQKREVCECKRRYSDMMERYERLKPRIEAGVFDDDLQKESITRYYNEAVEWLRERGLIPK